MREIKFRAVSLGYSSAFKIEKGDFIVGSLIYFEGIFTSAAIMVERGGLVEHINVDPETISQFTGVYTNAGKPIYENDFLSVSDEDSIDELYFIVKFIDGAFMAVPYDESKRAIKTNEKPELLNSYVRTFYNMGPELTVHY